jgi:hypothetical protein
MAAFNLMIELSGSIASTILKTLATTGYRTCGQRLRSYVNATNAVGTVLGGDEPLVTRTATKPPAAKPPSITGAGVTSKRFRVGRRSTAISAGRAPVGTSFRFRLSAPAKVQATITRTAKGLRRGRNCVAPTARLRRSHAKRCTRTLTVGTLTRAKKPAATDVIPFSGRIGTRGLPPRAYEAVLRATDAAGRSRPVVLSFTVVR